MSPCASVVRDRRKCCLISLGHNVRSEKHARKDSLIHREVNLLIAGLNSNCLSVHAIPSCSVLLGCSVGLPVPVGSAHPPPRRPMRLLPLLRLGPWLSPSLGHCCHHVLHVGREGHGSVHTFFCSTLLVRKSAGMMAPSMWIILRSPSAMRCVRVRQRRRELAASARL